jgi:arylsulfatase A-like enzyme
VPITFAYISDAHDDHVNDVAFGPGEAGYVAQLAAYDRAFDKFFTRLAADGITTDNTLFVITSDENDHFAGGPPTPANCDGINVPCTYAKIGEIDANITSLLAKVDSSLAATPFDIHFDMVPVFYIQGNQAPGTPAARAYERAAAKLTAVSPITGNTDNLTVALADAAELKLLHMITGDPQRTPSFVMFGNADYFFLTSGPDTNENPGFAWNHGGLQPEITTTWLGLVGPGVKNKGVTGEIFSDHTDIRPTILSLVGLQDDYVSDGRVLFEVLDKSTLPQSLKSHAEALERLAAAYKAINAPLGPLAKASLRISTAALASGDATTDTEYQNAVAILADVTTARDALAQKIIAALDAAEFHGVPLDEGQAAALTAEADLLVAAVEAISAAF